MKSTKQKTKQTPRPEASTVPPELAAALQFAPLLVNAATGLGADLAGFTRRGGNLTVQFTPRGIHIDIVRGVNPAALRANRRRELRGELASLEEESPEPAAEG